MNIFYKFWQGEVTLWKSYWLIGELLNGLVIIVIFNIELKLFNNPDFFINVPFVQLRDLNSTSKLIILLWTIFITVGIWRSAEKYSGRLIWTVLTLIILSYRLFVLKEIFL